jgi:hypothetical protein
MEDDTPITPTTPPAPVRPARQSRRHLLVELVIVTAGVLIALLLEGLLEWNHYRALVRETRATITREIADNKTEVEAVLATLESRRQRLAGAQRFADELIAHKKTDITEMNLGFEFAELTAAAWHGAEQTGALAHMDYGDVQHYSQLYELQALYAEQQRRSLETLSAALAFFGVSADPNAAAVDDLKAFRQHVLTLRAQLMVEEQLARRLTQRYQESLAR